MTTKAKPSLEELEGRLKDKDQVLNLLKEGKFGEFIADYADAKNTANTDVLQQVKEETQRVMASWIKDNGGQIKRLNLDNANGVRDLPSRQGKVYNAKAPGARLDASDKAPDDMSEFLRAIWHHSNTLAESDTLQAKAAAWKKIQNDYGSVVPADGGFLIPETLRADLLQLAMENSIVRSRAQIIPMSSLAVPIPSVDETSRVSSVFGGIVAYWTEEGAAATESQAKFGRVRLEAKKLTIYSEAPNELVADAPAFGSFIGQNMPRAAAFYEDDAFLSGSGVGEPLGVLNGSGVVSVTRSNANLVDFDDVVNMFVRLLPGSYGTAVWLVSPKTVGQLLKLQLVTQNVAGTENVGGSGPVWLQGGSAIGGAPLTLLGRPVIISEKVPNLGTAGDLSLIDFSHYLIGDRQMMQATSSPHFKFSSDVTAYKIVERVDGRPWVNTALTPKNNGDTLSPYVTLAA